MQSIDKNGKGKSGTRCKNFLNNFLDIIRNKKKSLKKKSLN